MSDPPILIQNERYKAWSTNLTRLGSGAVAYAVVEAYLSGGVKLGLIVPLVAGGGVYWLGLKFLGLLQSEK